MKPDSYHHGTWTDGVVCVVTIRKANVLKVKTVKVILIPEIADSTKAVRFASVATAEE